MLFYVTWDIPAESRIAVYNIFGNMGPKDDEKDAGPKVRIIGRWHELNGANGHCICETSDASALYTWILNWAPVCDLKLMPVVDDAIARKCIQSKDYFVPKEA